MDNQFEKTFAGLAEKHILGQLPEMIPYYTGFKLVEKADDDRRAFGFAAFQVNKVKAHIPIIFYDGELSGEKVLCLDDYGIMAPAIPKWISTVASGRDVISLFSKLVKNPSKFPAFVSPNDITINEQSGRFGSKVASGAVSSGTDWKTPDYWLSRCGHKAAAGFFKAFGVNQPFANAVVGMFQTEALAEIARGLENKLAADADQRAIAEAGGPDVRVIDSAADPEAATLDRKEMELLGKNGIFVKDKRDNVSQLFDINLQLPGEWFTVSEPGIYMALFTDGETRPVICMSDAGGGDCLCGDCCGNTLNTSGGLIVDRNNTQLPKTSSYMVRGLDGSEIARSIPGDQITCRHPTDAEFKDMISKRKELGKAATLANVCSLLKEMDAEQRKRNGDKNTCCPCDCASVNAPETYSHDLCFLTRDGRLYTMYLSLSNIGERLTVLPAGERTVYRRYPDSRPNMLIASEDCRVFKRYAKSDNPPPALADMDTARRAAVRRLKLHELSVTSNRDDNTYAVKSAAGDDQRLTLKQAAVTLTLRDGVHGAQAVGILKDAIRNPGKPQRFHIKYAEAPRPLDAERDMLTSVGAQVRPPISTITVGMPPLEDSAAMSQQSMDGMVEAFDKQDKDMFTVRMLEGLVKLTDNGALKKEVLDTCIKNMTALGKFLVDQYWHRDRYEQMFGDDRHELQEKTEAQFKGAGDLALYLKEKVNGETEASVLDTLSRSLGSLQGDGAE